MKKGLLGTTVLIVLAMIAFTGSPVQGSSPGPYYAIPAWRQQLPASTRFIVLSNWGDAAVPNPRDRARLEKSTRATDLRWKDALVNCTTLTLGNRKGWRLPTVEELLSLVNPTQLNPALPAGHPFVNVMETNWLYWSATTDEGYAWIVSFTSGIEIKFSKIDDRVKRVWCVRGGQGINPQ